MPSIYQELPGKKDTSSWKSDVRYNISNVFTKNFHFCFCGRSPFFFVVFKIAHFQAHKNAFLKYTLIITFCKKQDKDAILLLQNKSYDEEEERLLAQLLPPLEQDLLRLLQALIVLQAKP
jgi:hypothetical protein